MSEQRDITLPFTKWGLGGGSGSPRQIPLNPPKSPFLKGGLESRSGLVRIVVTAL